MTLTLFIFIGIVLFILLMLFLTYKVNKTDRRKQPFTFSLVALGLIVLNWILFLTNTYVMLPHKISEIIFTPIWFIVSIVGFIAGLKEFRNNLVLALLIVSVSVISSIIGFLSILIGSM